MMTTRKKIGTGLGFLALAIAVATTALWMRQINHVAIPGDRTLFVVCYLAAPVLGIAAFIAGTKWYGGIPALLAIPLGLFMPFTIYISPQQVADNPVSVGDTIPAFVALDDSGDRFNSDDLSGRPTLIKFFRGHW